MIQLIKTIAEMQAIAQGWEKTVGFIPTMGALHRGHLSLVEKAKEENEILVVSIYVNPSQFSPNEDLSNYPRTLERDIKLLEKLDVDYVFFPSDREMYPDGYLTWIEVNEITEILCGKSRPSHFKGVTTIVTKLLNLVNPTSIYMGEKDFQQLTIIKKMVKDLNMPFNVVGCPLIRENDGLALSSRNKYLSSGEREDALSLYRSLKKAKELYHNGTLEISVIKKEMNRIISEANGMIEYIEFINPQNFHKVDKLNAGIRILLAVKIGHTRLIDNMEI